MAQALARYDEFAEWYERWIGDARPLIVAHAGLLPAVAGERVLDLACGQGRVSRYLAGLGADVLGVDISAAMLAKHVPWARSLHFLVMAWFVVSIVIHVTLVFTTGLLRNLNHLYAGATRSCGYHGADVICLPGAPRCEPGFLPCHAGYRR